MSEKGEASFEPDPIVLETIMSMGISEAVAKEALFCTGNKSAEIAIDYIFNNPGEILNTSAGSTEAVKNSSNESGKSNTEMMTQDADNEEEWEDEDLAYYKMIFVVNTSLKMGTGKIAAQVGHACLGLYRDMLGKDMQIDLNQWEEIGEKKIVLKGKDADQLLELYQKAQAENVPAYLVRDAGHTQIPSGSITVLSLFGIEENVNKISGGLSLL